MNIPSTFLRRGAALLLSASLLSACSDDADYDFEASRQRAAPFVANFDPSAQVLPFPNDVLFSGTTDGTLNIPISDDPPNASDPRVAINQLDGFSVSSPISTTFSKDIAADSAVLNQTVHVFELARPDANTVQVAGRLTAADVQVAVSGTRLAVVPLRPLKESTTYLLVLTNGIRSVDDQPASASSAYNLAAGSTSLSDIAAFAALEPLRQATVGLNQLAASQDIAATDIVLSWSVTTQSIRPTLESVKDSAAAGTVQLVDSGQTTQTFIPQAPGAARVFVGSLQVPYYLSAPSQEAPTAALTGIWRNAAGQSVNGRTDPTPVATGNQIIPVIASVPAGDAPAEGWPMVIFQHGITSNRTALLGIADTLASAGMAAIAIDLPLHGLTGTHPLKANPEQFANISERTFGMDLLNNETSAAGPDGVEDGSGAHFINLSSLLTSRDNLRQAVSDLLVLRRSLDNLNGVAVNQQRVYFLGQSLGSIVGTTYLGVEDAERYQAAGLSVPGSGVPGLLAGSATFGSVVRNGLEANGIAPDSEEFNQFLLLAQTAVDAADPFNYGAEAVSRQNILLHEVVGGNSAMADQVIPNSVAGSAISGTEPLIRIMGLQSFNSTTADATGLDVVARFVAGAHASLLDPSSDLATTQEMQGQMASFFVSNGQQANVNNADVLQ